ncbi:MAG: hypothetical protein QOE04_916, partial [Mycobacterium sp.]|nr:hypothetical protein [Mycobacterium sp.]
TCGRGGELYEYDLLAVDVAVTDDDSAHDLASSGRE